MAEIVLERSAMRQTRAVRAGRLSLTMQRGGARLVIGGVIIISVVLMAVFADLLAPYGVATQNLDHIAKSPSPAHLMGTDELGRDIFSRLVFGARVSLYVGFVAVGLAAIVGISLGLVAGFTGGPLDQGIMRIMDVVLAFPALLLALAITAALGPGITNVMIAVGIVGVPIFARLVRAEVLSVRERDFVMAARTVGMQGTRIMLRHILPNVLSSVIVLATLRLGTAILSEASLSFLGIGIRPPTPSWGWMTNMGRPYLEIAPWVALFPGAAIFITVLGFNFLGDGIRDLLDPRLKQRQ